ncbi:MAG: hypothetical protein J5494_09185, partial [Candidatus Methanomethylophilaceae archaeon]|nr:hypothetical protein [Candidatus Methanomethylophilaceae archaeon]
YGRYAYVGGKFHCCVGNETGLFRVDLNTGRIEKIVDSAETVTSVVTDGAKIYYSTYTGYDVPTSWKYSLKCADLEKKEITEILSDVDYPIRSLKMSEGNLFFNSGGRGGIRCLFPDGTLRSVSSDSCSEYAVDRDTVYTFSLSTDGTDFVYKVCACNLQGERIGFSETRESAEESGNHTRRKRCYVGSGRDGITVFDGRVVFFDDQGVWLEDLADGSTEKILDDPFGFEDPYSYEFVSKAVFDGKLFLCWSDENRTDRLIIYDSGEVRQMTLG